MKELSAQIIATVQTASTLVKLVPSAERVEEKSRLVADFWKGVAGLGTFLLLVAICTRIVLMYAEARQFQKHRTKL